MKSSSSLPFNRAANQLAAGRILAYPTEAVWGLGCDPHRPDAILDLLTIKQRSWRKGFILIAANVAQLTPFWHPEFEPTPEMWASWPGPYSWLVPKHPEVSRWISGDSDRIVVRVSAHPVVTQLCLHFGGAVISTSANRSHQPPARTQIQCRHRFSTQIDYIAGAIGGAAQPTPIRDALSGVVIRR